MDKTDYMIVVTPLPEDQGGGYLGFVPDLKGCVGDGDTHEAAVADTLNAIDCWIEAQRELGRDIPAPGSADEANVAEAAAREELIEKQEELLVKQHEIQEELRQRIATLEEERASRTYVGGWRPGASFENPATAKREKPPRPTDPMTESGADVLPFGHQ